MKKKYGKSALIKACEKGHIEIVKELIERGADINAKNNGKRRRDMDGQH